MLRSKFDGHEISSRQRTVNASFVCPLQLTTKSGLPTSLGLLGFGPAIILAFTKVLRTEGFWLRYVLSQLESIRNVAPKVAGSSPVGHPNLLHCDEVKELPRGPSRLGANAAYRDTGQSGCPTRL